MHGQSVDRRVVRSRDAVLSTAAQLLIEGGQAWVTMERVAERSGVAKTTVYRHWSSRSVLLLDAFKHLLHTNARAREYPPSGNPLRERLIYFLKELSTGLTESMWAPAVSGLIDAADRDPEMRELMRQFLFELMAGARASLKEAVVRGELAAATLPDVAVDLLVGPVFYRRFVSRAPLDHTFVEAVVDGFLAGARFAAIEK